MNVLTPILGLVLLTATSADHAALDAQARAVLEGSASDHAATRELAKLGPKVVPSLWSAFRGGRLAGAEERLPPARREVVVDALGRLRDPHVVDLLGTHVGGSAAERNDALRLLAAIGRAEDLSLARALVEGPGGDHRTPDRFEIAVREILARDRAAFRELGRVRKRLAPELQGRVVRAVGVVGGVDALSLLTDALGVDDALDALALEQIDRVARSCYRPVSEPTPDRVLRLLRSRNAAVRAATARCLGALEDTTVAPPLIEALADHDPAVRSAARTALADLSGLTLGASQARWTVWLTDEQAWLEEHRPALFDALESDEPGAVAASVLELSQHGLDRSSTVERLTELVSYADSEQIVMACAAFGRLGSRFAVPPLLELLEDRDDAVREAAATALRALTDADHPADAETWRAALPGATR